MDVRDEQRYLEDAEYMSRSQHPLIYVVALMAPHQRGLDDNLLETDGIPLPT